MFEWRAESKSEAKKLGFKPNKKAVAHELNQSPDVAKDPRSLEQSMKWDATRTAWVERGQKLSLVVDIMEGRRIGMDEVPTGMSNYLALKLEVLKDVSNGKRSVAMVDPEREAMYSMFSEGHGSNYSRWIDSFHMSAFPVHNVQFVKYDVTVSFMAQVLDTVTYLVPQVLDTAS